MGEVKTELKEGICGGCSECASLEDSRVRIHSSFSWGKNNDPSKSTLKCFDETVKGNLTLKGEARRLRYWEPVLTAANEASRVLGANPKTHNTHNNN